MRHHEFRGKFFLSFCVSGLFCTMEYEVERHIKNGVSLVGLSLDMLGHITVPSISLALSSDFAMPNAVLTSLNRLTTVKT